MITYKVGDATRPEESPFVIVHCCNNIGGWGSGFVRAIDATFGYHVGEEYRRNHSKELGDIQFVGVNGGWVCNLVGQHGVKSPTNPRPIRYTALVNGLLAVNEALERWSSPVPHVVMPRIGAGLAGGSWDMISDIIEITMPKRPVTVYDLPGAVEGKDWNP